MTGLDRLNGAGDEDARSQLERCCGASRWVAEMVARRPYRDAEALQASAAEIWSKLGERDLREAFSHHPRIGDVDALRKKFAETRAWAAGEQAGASGASELTLKALAAGNDAYERRFGYIFIVCATGKSAEEMLAMLESRLPNAPEIEIKVAAAEQAKITRLRLERLLSP